MDLITNKKLKRRLDGLRENPPRYSIGVSDYGKEYSYCLACHQGTHASIIILKSSKSKQTILDLKREVVELQKIFEAEIIQETK